MVVLSTPSGPAHSVPTNLGVQHARRFLPWCPLGEPRLPCGGSSRRMSGNSSCLCWNSRSAAGVGLAVASVQQAMCSIRSRGRPKHGRSIADAPGIRYPAAGSCPYPYSLFPASLALNATPSRVRVRQSAILSRLPYSYSYCCCPGPVDRSIRAIWSRVCRGAACSPALGKR